MTSEWLLVFSNLICRFLYMRVKYIRFKRVHNQLFSSFSFTFKNLYIVYRLVLYYCEIVKETCTGSQTKRRKKEARITCHMWKNNPPTCIIKWNGIMCIGWLKCLHITANAYKFLIFFLFFLMK